MIFEMNHKFINTNQYNYFSLWFYYSFIKGQRIHLIGRKEYKFDKDEKQWGLSREDNDDENCVCRVERRTQVGNSIITVLKRFALLSLGVGVCLFFPLSSSIRVHKSVPTYLFRASQKVLSHPS